ncbi:MAG: MlaD family protein [Bdellovibrionaceae bacterium]|nr:MlaD family protein [Pseudobdellovibrionaceae bacterium]
MTTRVRFNKFERVAGLFIGVAILGSIMAALSIAVKQGWFEPKIYFHTTFQNADGVHTGTLVQMSGLRAGSVDDVELQEDNKIKVTFYILGKFRDRVKTDSRAQLIRPFVIGDRVLDVTVGSPGAPLLPENEYMAANETLDIMTIMSGKTVSHHLSKLTSMVENLSNLAQALLSRERTESFVSIFDRISPLIDNLNVLSTEFIKLGRQATHQENLKHVLSNANKLTHDLNLIIPGIVEANPGAGREIGSLIGRLNAISAEMNQMMAELGPDGPAAARRAYEALNEATILIKAMQRSYFFRDAVSDIRKEESTRSPASRPATPPPKTCEPSR